MKANKKMNEVIDTILDLSNYSWNSTNNSLEKMIIFIIEGKDLVKEIEKDWKRLEGQGYMCKFYKKFLEKKELILSVEKDELKNSLMDYIIEKNGNMTLNSPKVNYKSLKILKENNSLELFGHFYSDFRGTIKSFNSIGNYIFIETLSKKLETKFYGFIKDNSGEVLLNNIVYSTLEDTIAYTIGGDYGNSISVLFSKNLRKN